MGGIRTWITKRVDGKGLVEGLDRVNALLEFVPFRLGLVDGVLVYRFKIGSVMQGWALGLLALHDSGRTVRYCDECGQYFVRWRPKNHQQLYCTECAEERRRDGQIDRQFKYRNTLKLIEMIEAGHDPQTACADLGLDAAVLTRPKVAEAIANAPPPSRRRLEPPSKMWKRRLIEEE